MGSLISQLVNIYHILHPAPSPLDHDWEEHDASNRGPEQPIPADWSDSESEHSCDESCTCGNPLGNPMRD